MGNERTEVNCRSLSTQESKLRSNSSWMTLSFQPSEKPLIGVTMPVGSKMNLYVQYDSSEKVLVTCSVALPVGTKGSKRLLKDQKRIAAGCLSSLRELLRMWHWDTSIRLKSQEVYCDGYSQYGFTTILCQYSVALLPKPRPTSNVSTRRSRKTCGARRS